ncbi:hypothetical protein J2X69_002171 [Algoriphagus sp. 4150]|nr:hypothetical protein [Algoriphagus sp. 4150]
MSGLEIEHIFSHKAQPWATHVFTVRSPTWFIVNPINPSNPDYALGFVMRTLLARKSGCLETEA